MIPQFPLPPAVPPGGDGSEEKPQTPSPCGQPPSGLKFFGACKSRAAGAVCTMVCADGFTSFSVPAVAFVCGSPSLAAEATAVLNGMRRQSGVWKKAPASQQGQAAIAAEWAGLSSNTGSGGKFSQRGLDTWTCTKDCPYGQRPGASGNGTLSAPAKFWMTMLLDDLKKGTTKRLEPEKEAGARKRLHAVVAAKLAHAENMASPLPSILGKAHRNGKLGHWAGSARNCTFCPNGRFFDYSAPHVKRYIAATHPGGEGEALHDTLQEIGAEAGGLACSPINNGCDQGSALISEIQVFDITTSNPGANTMGNTYIIGHSVFLNTTPAVLPAGPYCVSRKFKAGDDYYAGRPTQPETINIASRITLAAQRFVPAGQRSGGGAGVVKPAKSVLEGTLVGAPPPPSPVTIHGAGHPGGVGGVTTWNEMPNVALRVLPGGNLTMVGITLGGFNGVVLSVEVGGSARVLGCRISGVDSTKGVGPGEGWRRPSPVLVMGNAYFHMTSIQNCIGHSAGAMLVAGRAAIATFSTGFLSGNRARFLAGGIHVDGGLLRLSGGVVINDCHGGAAAVSAGNGGRVDATGAVDFMKNTPNNCTNAIGSYPADMSAWPATLAGLQKWVKTMEATAPKSYTGGFSANLAQACLGGPKSQLFEPVPGGGSGCALWSAKRGNSTAAWASDLPQRCLSFGGCTVSAARGGHKCWTQHKFDLVSAMDARCACVSGAKLWGAEGLVDACGCYSRKPMIGTATAAAPAPAPAPAAATAPAPAPSVCSAGSWLDTNTSACRVALLVPPGSPGAASQPMTMTAGACCRVCTQCTFGWTKPCSATADGVCVKSFLLPDNGRLAGLGVQGSALRSCGVLSVAHGVAASSIPYSKMGAGSTAEVMCDDLYGPASQTAVCSKCIAGECVKAPLIWRYKPCLIRIPLRLDPVATQFSAKPPAPPTFVAARQAFAAAVRATAVAAKKKHFKQASAFKAVHDSEGGGGVKHKPAASAAEVDEGQLGSTLRRDIEAKVPLMVRRCVASGLTSAECLRPAGASHEAWEGAWAAELERQAALRNAEAHAKR